jgi:hypothetical protein
MIAGEPPGTFIDPQVWPLLLSPQGCPVDPKLAGQCYLCPEGVALLWQCLPGNVLGLEEGCFWCR